MAKAIDFSAALKNGKDQSKPGEKVAQPPAKVDPFDLAPVKKRLIAVDKAVADMANVALAHKVTDEASNKLAVEMMGQNATLMKKIETMRKEITDQPRKFVSAVNSLCKRYTDGLLKNIKVYLGEETGAYVYRQDMKRQEAQRKAQEEARKLQAKLDKEAKEKHIEAPVVLPPVLPDAQTTTRTEAGTAHLRVTWTHEVIDESLVPREFCVSSKGLIQRAVDGGAREIPGVKIFEKRQTIVRT